MIPPTSFLILVLCSFSFFWMSLARDLWTLLLSSKHRLFFLFQQLQLMGSREQHQQLWHMGSVAPQHVEPSWTKNQSHTPCISRWILIHCATKEVLAQLFIVYRFCFSSLLPIELSYHQVSFPFSLKKLLLAFLTAQVTGDILSLI